jgi:hypothetical protein
MNFGERKEPKEHLFIFLQNEFLYLDFQKDTWDIGASFMFTPEGYSMPMP